MGFFSKLGSFFFGDVVDAVADTVQENTRTKASIEQTKIQSELALKKAQVNADIAIKKAETDNVIKLQQLKTQALSDAYAAKLAKEAHEANTINSEERVKTFTSGYLDEFLVISTFGLIILSVTPFGAPWVIQGFMALDTMPDFLQLWMTTMVSAVFGVNKTLDIVDRLRASKPKMSVEDLLKLKEALSKK